MNNLLNKCYWDSWLSRYKTKNLDPYLIPYTDINSNRIKHLNVRVKTIKFLEKNTEINLCGLVLD